MLLLFVLLLFSFLSEVFSFLTGLSSLPWPSGFWLLALPVGVCSLECDNNNIIIIIIKEEDFSLLPAGGDHLFTISYLPSL